MSTRVAEVWIDNRVRINRRTLRDIDIAAIKKLFKHKNEQFGKLRSMGFNPFGKEMPFIETWLLHDDHISVPRGGYARVRQYLKSQGFKIVTKDLRFGGKPIDPKVRGLLEFRPYQERAAAEALKMENCLITSPTGCIAGDALVRIRKDNGVLIKLTLEELHRVFNRWSKAEVLAPMADGSVRFCRLIRTQFSGIRFVNRIVIEADGETDAEWIQTLDATTDHRFKTPSGWTRLDQLKPNDRVYVDSGCGFLEEGKVIASWPVGKARTFDLEVDEAEAFVANDIAVHNSGKTSLIIGMMPRVQVWTLVIVDSNGIALEWQRRAKEELDLKGQKVGFIGGGRFELGPVTVAMNQSLNAIKDDRKWKSINESFGFVAADECFTAGAKVLMADGSEKAIELIRPGDETAVGGSVLEIGNRSYTGEFFRFRDSFCTPDHPVATTEGWFKAKDICSSDILYYDSAYGLSNLWEASEEGFAAGPVFEKLSVSDGSVSPMQQGSSEGEAGLPREFSVRYSTGLEQGSELEDERISQTERRVEKGSKTNQGAVRANRCEVERPRISEESFGKDFGGATQAVFETGGSREGETENEPDDPRGRDSALWGPEIRQRGESDRLRAPSREITEAARIRSRVSDQCPEGGDSLQDRFCTSDFDDRDRARREQSRSESEIGRQAEDILPRVDRVVGIPLPGRAQLRPGKCGATVRRCLIGRGQVYNIKTERGVFVAEGVLVHNCQTFAAGTFQNSIDFIPARYRIGVSDDYRRPDKKEFLITDMFGDVACRITDQELFDANAIDEVAIHVARTEFDAPWYRNPFGNSNGKYTRLQNEVSQDPKRNTLIADLTEEEVAAGHQLLVVTDRREHSQALLDIFKARGIPAAELVSGTAFFQKACSRINAGIIKVGVGTKKSLGKGINLPGLSRGVNAGLIPSNLQPFRQLRGRFARPTGDSAFWCLWDERPLGRRPLKNLMTWNRLVSVRTPEGMVTAEHFVRQQYGRKR